MAKLAVIRIRGTVDVDPDSRYTLELLRLFKKFHAVIVSDNDSYRGMLKKIQNYVTWGEIDEDTLTLLLEKRGRLVGNRKLNEKFLRKYGFSDARELAKAILKGKLDLKDLPELKPVFRLHPPRGGFKGSIRKQYGNNGELGYRGKAINDLLRKMI
ncbi:MAG: 50S ribosomal protein L30 [Thermofilum sp. ex4484_15]|nr:MAG: 50S ribosomal protein L30 [Thermofilum sp. ex4484_15]